MQRFALEGRPAGAPLKLEKAWGAYHDDKNWEGLDWTLSGAGVVMAYDEKDADKHRALVVPATPDRGPLSILSFLAGYAGAKPDETAA